MDAGTLDESWRFEPEGGAYTRIYLADPDVPAEHIMQAPAAPQHRSTAAPLPADKLQEALRTAQRVKVAARTF